MFIIEYLVTPKDAEARKYYSELALGSTAEEARDQADTHFPTVSNKYGVCSYRIFDADKRCVAIGPEGFQGS